MARPLIFGIRELELEIDKYTASVELVPEHCRRTRARGPIRIEGSVT